jgi:hypothetical protein
MFCSMVSVFTINDDENDRLFVEFLKIWKNKALFDKSLNEYLW